MKLGWKKLDRTTLASHIFWIVVWVGFYFIWGRWKWRTAEFGTLEWMFDNYGHALGGMLAYFHVRYEVRYFFPMIFFGLLKRKLILYIVIPAVVLMGALLWEGGEMIHDFQGYAMQAQKGGADTTIDIMLTVVFAYLGALLTYGGGLVYSRWRNPSEIDEEEFKELEERIKLWHEEGEEIRREVRTLRRNKRKESFAAFRNRIKEFFKMDDEEDFE